MKPTTFYLSLAQVQAEIDRRFRESGERQNPYRVVADLHDGGASYAEHRNGDVSQALRACGETEFLSRWGELYTEYQLRAVEYRIDHPFVPAPEVPATVAPHHRSIDVFVDTLFHNAISLPHAHQNLFEVVFVYRGHCHFVFEGEHRLLSAGDFCVIAPASTHEIYIDGPEDFVVQQFIYGRNFRDSFINILEDDSVIPNFFRMILANQSMHNFLLFSTANNDAIRQTARSVFLEQFSYDEYAPSCTLYWMQLLFTYILRHGIHACQLSSGLKRIDFAPVLEYLRKNYKTATLSDVAAHFHYSVAYLSACIKRITGRSYSSIVKDLKLREAAELLIYTDRSIDDISRAVGYHSADHFSRVFRACHGISPSAYRKSAKA